MAPGKMLPGNCEVGAGARAEGRGAGSRRETSCLDVDVAVRGKMPRQGVAARD